MSSRADMDFRQIVASRIREIWEARGRPAQAEFGELLGLNRRKTNDLLNGRLQNISMETLLTCGVVLYVDYQLSEIGAPPVDLAPPPRGVERADMQIRRQLAVLLHRRLEILEMTQTAAADQYGLCRGVLSSAVTGSNVEGTSLKLLLEYAHALGLKLVLRETRVQ